LIDRDLARDVLATWLGEIVIAAFVAALALAEWAASRWIDSRHRSGPTLSGDDPFDSDQDRQ